MPYRLTSLSAHDCYNTMPPNGTDIEIDIEQVVASSEQVAVRATATGTQCESLWTSHRPAARSISPMHGSAGSITGKSRRFGRCRMASVSCRNLTPSLNYRRTAPRLSRPNTETMTRHSEAIPDASSCETSFPADWAVPDEWKPLLHGGILTERNVVIRGEWVA